MCPYDEYISCNDFVPDLINVLCVRGDLISLIVTLETICPSCRASVNKLVDQYSVTGTYLY